MTNYRRDFVSGGTYFFTVALDDHKGLRLIDEIELLLHVFGGGMQNNGDQVLIFFT